MEANTNNTDSHNAKDLRFEWFTNMQDNKGVRAQLRRCTSPAEAAMYSETMRLHSLFKDPHNTLIEAVACIAGVSAHIEDHKLGSKLAQSLGAEKNGKKAFSESRFRQLLKSHDWDELYRNLRRAVKIAKNNVDFRELVEIILDWDREFKNTNQSFSARYSIKYRLSNDYYISQKGKEK